MHCYENYVIKMGMLNDQSSLEKIVNLLKFSLTKIFFGVEREEIALETKRTSRGYESTITRSILLRKPLDEYCNLIKTFREHNEMSLNNLPDKNKAIAYKTLFSFKELDLFGIKRLLRKYF